MKREANETRSSRFWYYTLEDGQPVACPDLLVWAAWFEESAEQRRVARDQVGRVTVSTVFLALDHAWSGGPRADGETFREFRYPVRRKRKPFLRWYLPYLAASIFLALVVYQVSTMLGLPRLVLYLLEAVLGMAIGGLYLRRHPC